MPNFKYFRKRKIFFSNFLFSIFLLCSSCEKDSLEKDSLAKTPEKVTIPITYSDERGYNVEYKAIRIGEYLWMNSNFNSPPGFSVKREEIIKVLDIYEIDPNNYLISGEELTKHYGFYYDRQEIEYMVDFGKIHEGTDKTLKKWILPAKADFQQLFAMCGHATERDIRVTLTCRIGDNPLAINVPKTYWFSSFNSNKYGFNLMPGGARFHNTTTWKIYYPNNTYKTFLGNKGDFYAFFEAAIWAASDGTVSIHDYPDTTGPKLWHWLQMRWCRKLTNEELGYRLYINSNRTDIKKLKLSATPPSNYTELPNGYLRGFYVQYILDKPNPEKTISEIVKLADNIKY